MKPLRRRGRPLAALALAFAFVPGSGLAATRSLVDRPDDFAARTQQIHVLYVLPSDGTDRQFDTSDAIPASVDVAREWMSLQTGGKPFRLDTYRGVLDVTFVRLASTDAELASHGVFLRDELEAQLGARGFTDPFKLYGVFYDGTANEVCGGAPWPPALAGHVIALYLRGRFGDPTIPDCDTAPFAAAGGAPGYREFSFLHELVHATGNVPTCAPHFTLAGHTGEDPSDLMYAGNAPWQPSTLDPGHDDDFAHGRPSCLDLATSGYLLRNATAPLPGETLPPAAQPPPPPVSPPQPPPHPPPSVDVTPPALEVTARGSQALGRTVKVTVSCLDEACRANVGATVRVPSTRSPSAKTHELTTIRGLIARGTALTAKLRFTAATRSAIKRALRAHHRVIVSLQIRVADTAGNTKVVIRRIRIRL